jgi:hypothetical protein
MSKTIDQVKLRDGTMIRHRVVGYEGRIEGTTEIKTCFTAGGALLDKANSGHTFQYRVVVSGESMRRIAPAEDLEILEGVVEVVCLRCGYSFHSKPGLGNKPGGRCLCGGWICPACLTCQDINGEAGKGRTSVCPKQRERQIRKLAAQKRRK